MSLNAYFHVKHKNWTNQKNLPFVIYDLQIFISNSNGIEQVHNTSSSRCFIFFNYISCPAKNWPLNEPWKDYRINQIRKWLLKWYPPTTWIRAHRSEFSTNLSPGVAPPPEGIIVISIDIDNNAILDQQLEDQVMKRRRLAMKTF